MSVPYTVPLESTVILDSFLICKGRLLNNLYNGLFKQIDSGLAFVSSKSDLGA